jgi:hypothetical protein
LLPVEPGAHLRGILSTTAGPILMFTRSASPAATHPPAATSARSYISWALFVLAALAAVGMGVWWAALRPAANDPHVGPAADVLTLLGVGAAWWLALVGAVLGALFGLVGVLRPAGRTNSAWGAVALNAAVIAVSLLLLMALSP